MTKVEELLEQARALPPESQLGLYDALNELISPRDPEWEAAWEKECERCIAEVRSGAVEAEDLDEAMERLRQKYRLRKVN
jgi:hypothetical protein